LNSAIARSERLWGVEQARLYRSAIEGAFQRLIDHPELGAARDDIGPGLRVLNVRHHRVVYRFTDQRVIIVRVLHERMDL
jgi:toxin ParE1/3/4